MKYSNIIKSIRTQLGITQKELADAIGVSFATVNRWENDRCEPTQIAINIIKNLCIEKGIDYSEFENRNKIVTSNEVVTLYHGSKSGLDGEIKPISRDKCDFGKGFYMGTDKNQPLTLICNYDNAKLYTLELNLTGLKILDVEVGLDWAMLVAYNRGKMDDAKGTSIYKRIAKLAEGCDVIVGYIANDRMFVVLDRFFNGDITDVALINSLSALKFGKQYVAVTQKACDQIKIIKKKVLDQSYREKLKTVSEENRATGIRLADEICRNYRREGRFFDEILVEGKSI